MKERSILKNKTHQCNRCGDKVSSKRHELGYATCLFCGEEEARSYKHTIVPMNKSNYIVVTDMALLGKLNPKRVAD